MTRMARRTFFSFHYQRDIFRVNQIRNIPEVIKCAAAGFQDASLWERARTTSEAAVHRLIDEGLGGTSVTVVCIGAKTAGRKYINYEIRQSIARGNGLLGLHIHHMKNQFALPDAAGDVPAQLVRGGYKVYKYVDGHILSTWIEAAARDAGR